VSRLLQKIILNLGLSTLAILLAYSAFLLDRIFRVSLPDGITWLGWPLISAGTAIILWSVFSLVKNSQATGAPGDPTKELVRSGPYSRVRNPIYAADGLIILGLAFLTASPALIIYDTIYILAIDRYVDRIEEPALEKRFGPVYAVYKASVPRWFPRLLAERGSEG